jgi:hypothetical protein
VVDGVGVVFGAVLDVVCYVFCSNALVLIFPGAGWAGLAAAPPAPVADEPAGFSVPNGLAFGESSSFLLD